MINTNKQFQDIGSNITVYKAYIPSVAKGTPIVGPVDFIKMASEVEVLYLNITSKSTDFNFHIFSKAGAIIGEAANVFTMLNINKEYSPEKGVTSISPSNLSFFFKNEDVQLKPNMYFQIINNDGANATGIVTVEIGIRQA